ncbi:DNA polymerase III subunit gamma/tau [Vallitaleaceae bacterium 9-2]
MSYQALYRKWRPDHFDDLVGQNHIVRTLTNQVEAGRTSHAYLFCGTRGTGKTSTAKIFARAVNCENPIQGSPCNSCPTCQHMLHHQNMNVIEIDAASNNGVDNIREIREEVRYTPTEGKYKVYIIDEVHMLSAGAFNALLKTLEEPPEHVKFILATTEPHKIPATILSRCQRYDFKRISTETIAATLKHYLEEEAIEATDRAIHYIAKVADGSMRDGLSVLDQCIAFYLGEEITLDKVLDVLGAVDTDVFYELTEGIILRSTKTAMEVIERIVMQGRDLSQFLLDEIAYLRNLLVVNTIADSKELLDVSDDVYDALKKQSDQVEENLIIHLIKSFSNLESQIKYMTGKRTLIEIELIKLCQPELNTEQEAVLSRLHTVEQQIHAGMLNAERYAQMHPSDMGAHTQGEHQQQPQQVKQKVEINTDAFPEDIQVAIKGWAKVVTSTTGLLKATLKEVLPFYMNDQKLTLVCKNSVQKNTLSEEQYLSKIIDVLESLYKKRFELNVIEETEYSASGEGNFEDIERAIHKIRNKINFDVEIQ